MGKSKIDLLKRQAEEAEANMKANIERRNELAAELRELCAEEKERFLPSVRLLEIDQRKKKIQAKLAHLRQEANHLGRQAQKALQRYRVAQRRLEGARRVLDRIDNPPAWGLGDVSPAQVRAFEKRARQTIQELA